MIYVKSVVGGFAALLLAFVLFIVWIKHNLLPKGASFGFNPAHLLLPRMLILEVAIFLAGFVLVWFSLRHRVS